MSRNYRDHIERELGRVERDRCRPMTQDDVARLIADYASPDPDVRVKALKESCPCHVPWDVYDQLRKPALKLRRDPASRVRRLARHLEEDARVIRIFEADLERLAEAEEEVAEQRRKRFNNGSKSAHRQKR